MSGLEPRHLQVIERWTLILAALVIVVSALFTSRSTATAVAAGAGLMALNAWAIRRLTARAFRGASTGSRPGLAVLLFNLKMAVVIAAVFVAVKVLGLDAVGFIIGVSVFPVALVIGAVKIMGELETQGDPTDDTTLTGEH